MSRNIKEIGKELMGKSLNSFHRKTGLTQLEKNNEMQDGILDGILSQVDDAYIEKTEQSNVIHLDGSGDGVVVLDNIEGNTMVNLWDNNRNWSIYSTSESQGVNANCPQSEMTKKLKANTNYTYVVMGASENINLTNAYLGSNFVKSGGIDVTTPALVTTISDYNPSATVHPHLYPKSGSGLTESDIRNLKILFIEGDHRDKSLNWFEGLQSSFEEKVNEQGKYEIEILSNNKNLVYEKNAYSDRADTTCSFNNGKIIVKGRWFGLVPIQKLKIGKNYTISFERNIINSSYSTVGLYDGVKVITPTNSNGATFNIPYESDWKVILYCNSGQENGEVHYSNIQVEENTQKTQYEPCKQNKIKLLINEPLRKFGDIKDKLYIKDNRLIVKRKLGEVILSGDVNENWRTQGIADDTCLGVYLDESYGKYTVAKFVVSDKFPSKSNTGYTNTANLGENIVLSHTGRININILRSKLSTQDVNGFKQWLQSNPVKVVYELLEPIYEEVTNEYGEPIILEGYENGTIYIDSTIIPTTSIRYTPKMESFKALKEVNNNNIMLTNDVNDNIIPYMMDVDLMIMEKEMALMSQYKIRRIGAKDMTSMQKRTQDMLTRLIKGKTLTEQECKTRVVTYLDAGKITDAQADELMLLISEVYA